MTDANLDEFYGRVARIQKARAKGYGFEAEGALGRSYYYRPTPKRRSYLAPVLMIILCGIGMKSAVHYQVGDMVYQARVDRMLASDGMERLGGLLMAADPVTVFVSNKIKDFDI